MHDEAPKPMTTPLSHIATDPDHPILFRTMGESVFDSTLATGSIWLRSDLYYREIEDKVRHDLSEGVNSGSTTIPLNLQMDKAGSSLLIQGNGRVAQAIVPHYILSLHGSSISADQHAGFGGFTIGVKSIKRLAEEIYVRAKEVIGEHMWRFGQVAYQRTAFTVTANPVGTAPIAFGDSGLCLSLANTDVLRKDPVWPFIEQDEWRIVLFVEQYLDNNPDQPLRIAVDPGHFYPYLRPQSDAVNARP